MMTETQRESFLRETERLRADAHARGVDIRQALQSAFHEALFRHPDEEDRLLELWDRLTARPML